MRRRFGIVGMLVMFAVGFLLGYVIRSMPARVELVKVTGNARGGKAKPLTKAVADRQYPRYKVELFTDTSPIKGPGSAPVTIVEVSDFQCPYCARARKTVEKLLEEYKGKIRLVWHNNPLSFHRRAKYAARAAMAAHEQGKFWEYHDKLFENQQRLKDEDLERYAGEIGLNVEKWKKAYTSGKFDAQIAKEQAQAAKFGARGTPAFFINGRLLSGAQPQQKFEALIDFELARAGELMRKGVPASRVYAELTKNALTKAVKPKRRRRPMEDPSAVYKVPLGDSPVRGARNALVTIVLFSDFQCPYCGRVEPTLKKLLDAYKKDLRIVWKDNPLPFHKRAMAAARAARAAWAQGKFWEYHDKLFENQRALGDEDLERYAEEIGLDVAKWKKDYESGRFDPMIKADMALARRLGALGTPNSYVNGRKMVGAQPFERFKKVVEEELKKAESLLKKGVKRSLVYRELTKDGATSRVMLPLREDIDIKDAPKKGPASAAVTVVEFADFKPETCRKLETKLKKVLESHGDKVRVVFKHFPKRHDAASLLAAEASMAAAEQGKFWEFRQKLCSMGTGVSTMGDLVKVASALGLDVAKFKKALDSRAFKERVERDAEEGMELGVRAVPAVFVNGIRIKDIESAVELEKAVERELEAAESRPKRVRAFKMIPMNQVKNFPKLLKVAPKPGSPPAK